MTGKTRALRAIAGLPTDRPSVLPSIDVVYAAHCIQKGVGECFQDAQLHAQALMGALDLHPEIDGLYVNLCLTRRTAVQKGANQFVDAGGMHWYVPENDVGTVRSHEIVNLQDERLFTENPLKDGILDTFVAILPAYKEKYLIVPGITGPYSQLVFMLGLENVLLLMYDEPEALHKVLAQRAQLTLQWVKEIISLGAKAVWLGEGAASASIISPSAYAEFVQPYAKIVTDAIAAAGVPCFMHVCGDINPSLKEIVSTGVPALDVDYLVSMQYARAVAGPNVCLKGNLNPMDLLTVTAPKAEVISLCALKSTTGPFILGTGCLVARDTPKENVDAMVWASKKLATE